MSGQDIQLRLVIGADGTAAATVVKSAVGDVEKLSAAQAKSTTATQQQTAAVTALGNQLELLKGVAAGAFSIGAIMAAWSGYKQTADAVSLLDSRLRLATTGSEDLRQTQQGLFDLSQKLGASYTTLGGSLARIATTVHDLGGTTQQAVQITEILAATARLSGASTQEQAAAATQFAQALGSGVLQGDELRSILENNQRLSRALAEGLGVSTSELRKLGEEGKLTADVVARAVLSQRQKIESELSLITDTFAMASQRITNEFEVIIGELNRLGESSSLVQALAPALDTVYEALKGMRIEAEEAHKSIANGLGSKDIADKIELLAEVFGFVYAAANRMVAAVQIISGVIVSLGADIELVGVTAWATLTNSSTKYLEIAAALEKRNKTVNESFEKVAQSAMTAAKRIEDFDRLQSKSTEQKQALTSVRGLDFRAENARLGLNSATALGGEFGAYQLAARAQKEIEKYGESVMLGSEKATKHLKDALEKIAPAKAALKAALEKALLVGDDAGAAKASAALQKQADSEAKIVVDGQRKINEALKAEANKGRGEANAIANARYAQAIAHEEALQKAIAETLKRGIEQAKLARQAGVLSETEYYLAVEKLEADAITRQEASVKRELDKAVAAVAAGNRAKAAEVEKYIGELALLDQKRVDTAAKTEAEIAAIQRRAMIAEVAARTKHNETILGLLQNLADLRTQQAADLEDKQFELSLLGKSEEQQRRLQALRQVELVERRALTAAYKEYRHALDENFLDGGSTEDQIKITQIYNDRQVAILANAAAQREVTVAVIDGKSAYDKLNSTVDGFIDASLRGFKGLKDWLKNQFFEWLKLQVLKPLVMNILASLSGSGGGTDLLGIAASLLSGGSSGGSGSGIASSIGSTIIGALGSTFSSIGPTVLSWASSIFGGAFTALSSNVSALMAAGSSFTSALTTASTAVSASGTTLAASLGAVAGWAAFAVAAVIAGDKLDRNGWRSTNAPATSLTNFEGNRWTNFGAAGTALSAPGLFKESILTAIGVNAKWASILSGTGLAARIWGFSKPEATGGGITGTVNASGFEGSQYVDWKQKGGWFRSDRSGTDLSAVNAQFDAELDTAIKSIFAHFKTLGVQLGSDTHLLDGFSAAFKLSLYKLSDADMKKAIDAGLKGVADQMAAAFVDKLRSSAEAGKTNISGAIPDVITLADAYRDKHAGEKDAEGKYAEYVMQLFAAASSLRALAAIIGAEVSLLDMAALQQSGESLAQTFARVVTVFQATNEIATIMGKGADAFGAVGIASLEARERLIDLAGGLQSLTGGVSFYFEHFFTEEERLALKRKQAQIAVDEGFAALNLAVPTSREAFRALINGIDLTTAAGQKLLVELLKLAPSLDVLIPAVKPRTAVFDPNRNTPNYQIMGVNGIPYTKPPEPVHVAAPDAFYNAFYNAADRAAIKLAADTKFLNDTFALYDKAVPKNAAEFLRMVNAIDRSTAAGEAFYQLMVTKVAPVLADVMNAADAAIRAARTDAIAHRARLQGESFQIMGRNGIPITKPAEPVHTAAPEAYTNGFYSAADRAALKLAEDVKFLNETFARYDKTLPTTTAGFRAMVDAIDRTTQAGEDFYQFMVTKAAPAFLNVVDSKKPVGPTDSYLANNFSESEQAAYRYAQAQRRVNDGFAELGIAVPKNSAELVALVNAQDQSTAAGRRAVVALLELEPSLKVLFDAAKAMGPTDYYLAHFFTESQQAAYKMAQAQRTVNKGFEELGIAVPKNQAEFVKLVDSIDQSTAAGRLLVKVILSLAPAFIEATAAVNDFYTAGAAFGSYQVGDLLTIAGNRSAAAIQYVFNIIDSTSETLAVKLQRKFAAVGSLANDAWAVYEASLASHGGIATAQDTAALFTYDAIHAQQVALAGDIALLASLQAQYGDYAAALFDLEKWRTAQQQLAGNGAAALLLIEQSYQNRRNAILTGGVATGLNSLSSQLRAWLDKLLLNSQLSTLTPAQRLAESQRQYAAALTGNDANAITSAADAYLKEARDFYASGDAYSAIFAGVIAAITARTNGPVVITGVASGGNAIVGSANAVTASNVAAAAATSAIAAADATTLAVKEAKDVIANILALTKNAVIDEAKTTRSADDHNAQRIVDAIRPYREQSRAI